MISKIERRVTVPCILVIFLVLTWIREIFTVRAPNRRSNDKEEKQAKKDYYEASDSVLQTGFLLDGNRLQRQFTVKTPKCDYDRKHQNTR